jgi:phage terminase large subunit GpA-like protein
MTAQSAAMFEAEDLVKGMRDGMRPDPRLTLTQWADRYRYLSSLSAEPGRWRTSRVPHTKDIMDDLSALSPVEEIVLMKGAQLAFTELGFNWIGYIIDLNPAATLMVMPTDETVKRNSKMRFSPMVDATPRLRKKIKSTRARDSGNTIKQKDFPGGTILMTGANSPVGLRSVPAKNIILDEVDAYPMDLDGEGSPISLARARARTFRRRKILIGSTPTEEGKSIIAKEFEDSDQRYRFVPCPECSAMQVLIWERMKWDPGKPDTARYCCIHCEAMLEEKHKQIMFDNGQWRPTKPEKINPKRKGYHINSLYSPWYTWAEAVKDFEKGLNDITEAKTFQNTVLGLTFKGEGERPEWENIYNKRETYTQNTVNEKIAFLTAGVDVQRDRIELEIVGWSPGKISYSVDYRVILGKTEEKEVWQKLAKVLDETWTRPDGAVMSIALMCIDSQYNTQFVYSFCRKYPGRALPIRGMDNLAVIVSQPQSVDVSGKSGKKIGTTKQWKLGVSLLKSELYGWLKLNIEEDGTVPDGYCHFPQYDHEHFKRLTAEQLEFKIDKKGFRKFEWVKKHERNEQLDCRNYARAAASIYGMDRFEDDHWAEVYGSHEQIEPPKQEENRRKSSFWD